MHAFDPSADMALQRNAIPLRPIAAGEVRASGAARSTLSSVTLPGAGHTEDNLVVWLPDNGILFGGCLVRPLEWNSLGFVGDASIESWADSVRSIKSKFSGIVTVVPGHGGVGDAELLDHTIRLTDAVEFERKR